MGRSKQAPLVLPAVDTTMPTSQGSLQLGDDGRTFIVRGHPNYWQVTMFSLAMNNRSTWDHRGQAAAFTWSPNGEVVRDDQQYYGDGALTSPAPSQQQTHH